MSNKADVFEGYLHDLGVLLREYALEAKARAKAEDSTTFDIGYMASFHRTISLMQQQAEAFGIPLEKIALEGFDPDEELV